MTGSAKERAERIWEDITDVVSPAELYSNIRKANFVGVMAAGLEAHAREAVEAETERCAAYFESQCTSYGPKPCIGKSNPCYPCRAAITVRNRSQAKG